MKPDRIRTLLHPYLGTLPDDIEYKIQKYIDLLLKWGSTIPLTSIQNPEEIVRFHFGESLFALDDGEIRYGRLADVASGAGFPGLAIKLANSALSVTLIEPNKKKCAFLYEVARELELEDVQIISTGFNLSRAESGSFSFVTCRALGSHTAIAKWAHEKLIPGGSALIWVGEEASRTILMEPGWNWSMPKLIPGTRSRFLLCGKKIP